MQHDGALVRSTGAEINATAPAATAAPAALALVLAARRRPRHAEGAATLAAPGFTGESTAEIAPGVHLLGPRGRTQTNAYLVCGGSSWVLVDAG